MSLGSSSALQHGRPWRSILALCQVINPSLCSQTLDLPPAFPSCGLISLYKRTSSLNKFSACLPSLRPVLVAMFGDSAFTPNQRSGGKTSKKSHASYPSTSAHDAWPDTLQKTYIRAGSGSGSMKDVEMENILMSEGRVRSRDVLVAHDITVVGSEA